MLGRIARASSGLFMRSLTSHLHIHVSPTRSHSLLRPRRGRRTRRQPTSSSSSFPAYETCSPPSLFSFFLPSRGREGNEPTANVKPAGRRRRPLLRSVSAARARPRADRAWAWRISGGWTGGRRSARTDADRGRAEESDQLIWVRRPLALSLYRVRFILTA